LTSTKPAFPDHVEDLLIHCIAAAPSNQPAGAAPEGRLETPAVPGYEIEEEAAAGV